MTINEIDECVFRRTGSLSLLILKEEFMAQNEGLNSLKAGSIIALNAQHDPDTRSQHQDRKITDIGIIKEVSVGDAPCGETYVEVEWVINDIQAELIHSLGDRAYEIMSKVFSL